MIRIYDSKEVSVADILRRDDDVFGNVDEVVKNIIFEVKNRGDKALIDYALRFDGVQIKDVEVNVSDIDAAYYSLDRALVDVFLEARKNIVAFHENQLRTGFEFRPKKGVLLGQKITPIERVGIYVPGGTAGYPSTVFMNAIPARIAGVKEIIMVTPPAKDGTIRKEILAAAKVAGVDKVFMAGGAQAIAALAYGTESIPKVDKIVGPGNIFVATAKKQVFGEVSIDMVAGPSEIMIIADGASSAKVVAADMLSQAEHDRLATAILATNDIKLASDVQLELDRQLEELSRKDIASYSIDHYGKIIVCPTLSECVDIANIIAPEHLELMLDNAYDWLGKVKNAGSIFLGRYTPEALGDYFAGANHTLPTNGTARFSSPLSVDDFIKKTQYICYSKEDMRDASGKVARFAESEGLTAHAKSATVRFEDL